MSPTQREATTVAGGDRFWGEESKSTVSSFLCRMIDMRCRCLTTGLMKNNKIGAHFAKQKRMEGEMSINGEDLATVSKLGWKTDAAELTMDEFVQCETGVIRQVGEVRARIVNPVVGNTPCLHL
eukprot:TRINITY_DN67162_c7_g1_i1.p1 TRINITY_DN67162_c7_g1~~TRINITY_DN67162_c7_g1_i1.p1  ORF type:complete len:124 (+),score=9.10 TRINITY_DN67162_c7_g1_i1:69-440(+)